MRAAVVAFGDVTATTVDDPVAADGTLLVRVASAGINAADLLQRAGLYPAPPGSPADIPGMELAGTVEQVGSGVEGWAPGDAVMAIVGGGAQAELAVVHASHALAVPSGVSLQAAGAIPEAFATSHDALVAQAGLLAGDHLLVTGAAGGVGTAAIQLGHVLGATVVACVRDRRHRDALVRLGADAVVTPQTVGDEGPYDVVLELVGAQSLTEVQHHLARFARVVVIGVGAGSRVELDLLGVMTRRTTLTGSTLRSRSVQEKAAVIDALRRDVLPHLGSGALEAVLQGSFGLDRVSDAYEAFAAGGKLGKYVLAMSS